MIFCESSTRGNKITPLWAPKVTIWGRSDRKTQEKMNIA